MKQYAVEVLEKHSHGTYGKELYATWCLSETSKKGACSFASEILAGMSWREIFVGNDKYSKLDDFMQEMHIPRGCKLDDTIGYENADRCFSFRAELM